MPFPEPDNLIEIIEPAVKERGLDIEDVKTTKAGKKSQVVIRVDGDAHPSSDTLETLSREISSLFDAAEDAGHVSFGAGYTLEVSTPGVDLPLTKPRHWRRNRGRLVTIEFADQPGKTEQWRIGALNEGDAGASVEGQDAQPDSVALFRQRKKNLDARIARLENISRAVVDIEFARIPEAEKEAAGLAFAQAAEKAEVSREDNK